jgi:hypothetical protein
MLRDRADTKSAEEGNTYWEWIENYVAGDYVEAVRLGSGTVSHNSSTLDIAEVESDGAETLTISGCCLELLETHVAEQAPQRIEELVQIFIHATRVSFVRRHLVLVERLMLTTRNRPAGDWLLGDVPKSIDTGGRKKSPDKPVHSFDSIHESSVKPSMRHARVTPPF